MPQLTIHDAFDLAVREHQAGRLREAEHLYQQILAVQPNHAGALHFQGVVAAATGRNHVAVELIRRSIAIEPNAPERYCNLGTALRQNGQIDESIAAYRHAVSINPNLAQAHSNLGIALAKKGQWDEAAAESRRAIALDADLHDAYLNLGNVLKDAGRIDESIAAYREMIDRSPRNSDAYNNLATALTVKGDLDDALATFRKAIALRPDFSGAYLNLAGALCDRGRPDEALAAIRRSIALAPGMPHAHLSLGNILKDLGRVDEAVAAYRQAIVLEPDFAAGHHNLALVLLVQGDFLHGWDEFEWRWKWKNFPSPARHFSQPLWDGRPLAGKTVLLYAEQGFGDTLQFIRYLPMVAHRGGTVIVECQAELRRLLRQSFAQCLVLAEGEPLPAFDVQCPLMSLPRVFGTTLEGIPREVPYLRADVQLVEKWRERLTREPGPLKVGLVWAGGKAHANDRNRSIALSALAPLLRLPGISFFSLQKGKAAEQATRLPEGLRLIDWTAELNDFADTAALVTSLDLVISVDTAVAHLAGALGKPVWVLLPFSPDWRWLLDRQDSPWYPTMRLFRQKEIGQWDDVIQPATQCLTLQAHNILGNALKARGQLVEAIAAFRSVVALIPDSSGANANLAAALHASGQLHEAIASYRQAIALKPDFHQAWYNLGTALKDVGQLDEAIAAYRQAIHIEPNFSQAYHNLGNALLDEGRLDEAVTACRQAIALRPDSPEAYCGLGNALKDLGRTEEAAAAYRQALALDLKSFDGHNNLGLLLSGIGSLDEAIAAFRRAIEVRPDFAKAHINLGNALAQRGHLDEAIAVYRRAIAMSPELPESYVSLGNVLKDSGQLDEAIAAYRRAITLRPEYSEAHSNLVFALYFHTSCDARAIAGELRDWNRRHAEPLKPYIKAHANDRGPDRLLRIGYVSPDFREHPVGRFILPLLENHDHQNFEVFAYANPPAPDAMTEHLRSHTDAWRGITGLSDARVVDLVRDDRIDILVDLTLHTAHNRLLVFARKPAPVQVTWLAYPGSSGLTTIDYRLSDSYLDPLDDARDRPFDQAQDGPFDSAQGREPPGEDESVNSEQTIRLPETYWCYQPVVDLPCRPPPTLGTGFITFGCLNSFRKVNQPLLKLWARLLMTVPQSRLVLHCKEGAHRQRVLGYLEEDGVEPRRVTFLGMMPVKSYFESYHSIDIALDTVPHGGGTTTCDALWMGVPVVSLVGTTAVGRGGLSILSNIGLAELAAHTSDKYVQTAAGLASDVPRLKELRSTLRQRMEASPLMDAPKFARGIEAAYRRMWQAWCGSQGSGQ